MIYANFKYIDTAEGGPRNRNNIKNICEYRNDKTTDCYRTVFRFDKTYLNHFENTGSVSGFNGKHVADWIPFDIDSNDLEDAHNKTREFINRLAIDFEYDVEYLFFSGAKGFHVLIPAECFGMFKPHEGLYKIFKGIAKDIAGEIADDIYDINRLFRLTNTINSKTGLYKIPLTIAQFNKGMESIRELAKNKSDVNFYPFSDNVKNDQFCELYEKHENTKSKFKQIVTGGVQEGERNSSAIKIAGLLNSKGIDLDLAYTLLEMWNRGNKPPLGDKELRSVLTSAYRYGNGEPDYEKEVCPIWAIGDEYKNYVRSVGGVNIGIPEIDEKIRKIRPGQVMTIMGFTGNFKTSTLQSILSHYVGYSNCPAVMFELEMSRLDLFERAVQKEWGYGGRLVEEIFKDQDEIKTARSIVEELQKKYELFYVVDSPEMNFKKMERYLEVVEKDARKKVGLVGIDFLQLMDGTGRTRVEMMNNIASEMKRFAKRANVPLICLSQVTDVESNEDIINLMDSRDSKTIPHMSDYVLGLWINNNEQVIALLKNRKGGLTRVTRTIDKESLRFTV